MAWLIDHDRIAEVYEGTVGSREFQQVSRRRIHWMGAQVTGRDVLDVGCSQGIASILLGREGHRVVGIDREHEAVRAARERLDQEEPEVRDRVEFRIGEGRALGFPDDSFDSVLLGEVLEHQLDPGRVLDEARRVLRPGGRIVITTPYGVHPYPDHKEPLYLSALLEQLVPKLSIAEIALVDRYVGVVAELSKDRAPRTWRRALRVAERRLADQDNTVETLRALVAELRDGTRTLERSLQEEDLTKKATEIQRDAARRDLEETRERVRSSEREGAALADRAQALEAEKGASAREVERLHMEVRGARDRLHAIEVGHRSAMSDLERAQAEQESTAAERDAARTELDAAREELARLAAARTDLDDAREELGRAAAERARLDSRLADSQRLLQHERTRTAALESQREMALRGTADLEAELRRRDAELAEAVAALERSDTEGAAAAARLERVEAQLGASRARLGEARTRMAELIAQRDSALDSATSADRRADEADARATRARQQAAAEAKRASERIRALENETAALRGEAEGLRTTLDALTTEGASLRAALRDAELSRDGERATRRELERQLEGVLLRSDQLEQDLIAIRSRLGYRIGRAWRRLTFRRADDDEPRPELPAAGDRPPKAE